MNGGRKKPRSSNWTEPEKFNLIELMRIHGQNIIDKTSLKAEKDVAWANIIKGMHAQGYSNRNKNHVRDMWKRMKISARTSYGAYIYKRNSNETEGGSPPKKPCLMDTMVAELIPNEIDLDNFDKELLHEDFDETSNNSTIEQMSDGGQEIYLAETVLAVTPTIIEEASKSNDLKKYNRKRAMSEYEEKNLELNTEKINRKVNEDSILFKEKLEHHRVLFNLELEQKKEKHSLEMEILKNLNEKIKSSDFNALNLLHKLNS